MTSDSPSVALGVAVACVRRRIASQEAVREAPACLSVMPCEPPQRPVRSVSSHAARDGAALDTIAPGACPDSRTLLDVAELPSVASVAAVLTNELDGLDEDALLVLDDYHHIREPSIHELLTQLLRFPPKRLHLMIVSRADPPLPLTQFRTGGQMTELRLRDLEFNQQETATFLSKTLDKQIDESSPLRLHQVTEGWAVGLRLAALALQHRSDVGRFLENLKGGIPRVRDYLIKEVLSTQPAEYSDCLLKTSVLDRISARGAKRRSETARAIISSIFAYGIDDRRSPSMLQPSP